MTYESTKTIESKEFPGVRFTVRRMSFGRRLELTRKIKNRLARLEFLSAGEEDTEGEVDKVLLSSEIHREYAEWGLASVEGLEIDEQPATPASLLESGPETLVEEVLQAIYQEAGLSEEERKNSVSHSTSFKETGPGGNATTAAG